MAEVVQLLHYNSTHLAIEPKSGLRRSLNIVQSFMESAFLARIFLRVSEIHKFGITQIYLHVVFISAHAVSEFGYYAGASCMPYPNSDTPPSNLPPLSAGASCMP